MGTIYAEIGALVALGIARILGPPFVARILPGRISDEDEADERSEWRLRRSRGDHL